MDHAPVDYHDIAIHHDFSFDTEYRFGLIEKETLRGNKQYPARKPALELSELVRRT
jgi:hypothetical protein